MSDASQILHATAVSFGGKGMMLIGPSGSGKSSLAIEMMALGAGLIADDRVVVTRVGEGLRLSCPPNIEGLIEARGVGVLNAQPAGEADLAWVVDLAQVETERLPDPRKVTYLGVHVPLLWRVEAPHFAATLLHLLAHGRSTR